MFLFKLGSKLFCYICSLALIFLLFGLNVNAAEVLQITSSSSLLIGDNNRTYRVKLSCFNVYSEKEDFAIDWLRSELPRHTRINLRPKDFEEGVLIASVIPLGSDIEINKKIIEKGYGTNSCWKLHIKKKPYSNIEKGLFKLYLNLAYLT